VLEAINTNPTASLDKIAEKHGNMPVSRFIFCMDFFVMALFIPQVFFSHFSPSAGFPEHTQFHQKSVQPLGKPAPRSRQGCDTLATNKSHFFLATLPHPIGVHAFACLLRASSASAPLR
jgi:hypothetical protein